MKLHLSLLPAVVVLTFWGCSQATSSSSKVQGVPVSANIAVGDWASVGADYRYTLTSANLDQTRTVSLSMSLPLSSPRVFYEFTNVSTAAAASTAQDLSGVGANVDARTLSADRESYAVRASRLPRLEYPQVDHTWDPNVAPRGRALSASYTAPTVGDPMTFHDHDLNTGALVDTPVTLRLRTAAIAGRVLNIWVANDCWGDGTPTSTKPTNPGQSLWIPPVEISSNPASPIYVSVNQPMIQALADRFLKDGVNDIYGWDTGIFGREWTDAGSTPQGLIDGHGEINIFIKNLNPTGFGNGVLEGYFDSEHNIPVVWSPESNQMLLFALDANALADPTDKTGNAGIWAIDDYWPAETVSTLAHEFQHMIQFYQKGVIARADGKSAVSWINEMCSMMAEDLLSDKLLVPGPRGVALQTSGAYDYSTGTASNRNGRLPDFTYWHGDIPLTGWGSSSTVYSNLQSYANAYAFGAWLVRNYGGPALLRHIVQSSAIDETAVVDAVNALNPSAQATYATLVQQWGLATMLSGASVKPYQYTAAAADGGSAGRFDWSLADAKDGSTMLSYSLGSIDLANYEYFQKDSSGATYQFDGIWGYSSSIPLSSDYPLWGGASAFFAAGRASGASFVKTLVLPPNVALTVVVAP
jgi:hypothetical protein